MKYLAIYFNDFRLRGPEGLDQEQFVNAHLMDLSKRNDSESSGVHLILLEEIKKERGFWYKPKEDVPTLVFIPWESIVRIVFSDRKTN